MSPRRRKPCAHAHPSRYWLATEFAGRTGTVAPNAPTEASNRSTANEREFFMTACGYARRECLCVPNKAQRTTPSRRRSRRYRPNPLRSSRARIRHLLLLFCPKGRQKHGELAAQSETRAGRLHAAAMRLHQVTHHREPDATATFGPLVQRVGLHEELEYPCKHRRRNTDARVAKADAGMPADALHGERDVSTVGCVLGGVEQQVREHLLEASDVSVHPK